MGGLNFTQVFQQIRAERQRMNEACAAEARRDREKWAAYGRRSAAFNRLMNLFPGREGAGTFDLMKAAALMVEFAQTLSPQWVKDRVAFVSKRLAELSEGGNRGGSNLLQEISLHLLLVANAGDQARVAQIFEEAMRGDPGEVQSFRLCLANWLVDKVVDGWPPLPEELICPEEPSAEEAEALDGVLTRAPEEEWLPASKAVERANQSGRKITLTWLTRDAAKHGVRVRLRQQPEDTNEKWKCPAWLNSS